VTRWRAAVRACLAAVPLLAAACASAGDPPGGPPDTEPPTVLRIEPESGAVLTTPPDEADIYFSEVISERVTAQPPDIGGALLLSPAEGEVRVSWHRDRISVKPREGFRPGRIYHLELLPVIADLRTNRLREGRFVVFSTGPAIPSAGITGTVVDWVAGRPAVGALVEAILLPDSLAYRTLADSSGDFRIPELPPGRYLVRGVMDTNHDRRLGGREAFDSVETTLDSTGRFELYAFVHDTTGPRLRTVEAADSLTLKLTFDRALDPTTPLDTSSVTLVTVADSLTPIPLAGVYTTQELDSLQRHRADSIAAARSAADSTQRPAAPAQPPLPAAAPARGRPSRGRPTQPAQVRAGGRTERDTTQAMRMLIRRPAPSDVRMVRLTEPLLPDTRYLVFVAGARSLSGVASETARGALHTARARRAPRRNAAPDSSAAAPVPPAADSTRPPRDSTPPASPPDTTIERALPARGDTTTAPRP